MADTKNFVRYNDILRGRKSRAMEGKGEDTISSTSDPQPPPNTGSTPTNQGGKGETRSGKDMEEPDLRRTEGGPSTNHPSSLPKMRKSIGLDRRVANTSQIKPTQKSVKELDRKS